MKILRGTYRALAFFLGGGWMMLRIAFMTMLKGPDLQRSLRYRLHFLRWLIPTLGVRIEYYGEFPREAGLLMCNHRSYFDPIPVLRHVWAVPVGKASISKWPIIGVGAKMSGVVYVDRSTQEGRKAAREEINDLLTKGFSILIYPEGTIYPGPELGELKMGMFRDAAKNGYAIHPVALEYKHALDAWRGGISFVKHFYTRFGKKSVYIKVAFGEPLRSEDPEELASRFLHFNEAAIKEMREGWYIPYPKEEIT
ncbi:MAG: 1-acyl-sn-glycerol-3-phosphate acyltransferase [Flavobacteriales bacterium]|nr:1-acyl-sn-glycerol-3-phosphate acyltransferase [Flavobacteriales bacterium]